MRNVSILIVGLTLTACGIAPADFRTTRIHQQITVRGDPKEIASCVRDFTGMAMTRDYKTGYYNLSYNDPFQGPLFAVTFDPAGNGKTEVATRGGVKPINGDVPPWSRDVINAVNKCEQEGLRH